GIKSAIQGSNVPNPDEAVPSFVSGAMAKAGKGLLEGTLQAGTSAVSDKLLDLVGLGGAFLLLLSLLLPSLLIMFIPSTFKRPVSSWKALNLRKTLLMASSVRLKPLNCSRLPCVYAQETLTFLLTQKKTCVKNYVQKE